MSRCLPCKGHTRSHSGPGIPRGGIQELTIVQELGLGVQYLDHVELRAEAG